jgi:hypothetical protein
MGSVNPRKVGLVVGALVGGWHVLWAILVATGTAQAVINFIFWMHFIAPLFVVEPFHAGRALALILIATSIGFVIGSIAGVLWNWVQR